MRILPLLFLAPFMIITTAAHAQEDQAARIDQLEQDIRVMKRQMPRANTTDAPPADAAAGGGVASAQTDVRITALEEEIRNLRGKIEEQGFATKRVADDLDKFKRDSEFRMGELEKANPPAGTPAAANAAATPAPATAAATSGAPKKKLDVSVKEVPVEPATTHGNLAEEAQNPQPKPAEATTSTTADSPEGSTPRDHYNYAFRLLNQNQYDDAAKSFASFVKKYPKDPLVGNAYYWQGETYYIRKDYAKATDFFRQGYEAMPKGPKAGDNLLKLGMSLSAMKKDKEACIVLGQVMDRFKTASAATAAKAEAEHKRLNCE